MDVLSLASRLQSSVFGSRSDDDFSDRLNYRYTVGLLLLGSIIITTRMYGSEVIKCWVPAHFTSNYESYVSQICWVQNTYYFPMDQHIPKMEQDRTKNEIKYYQWVQFLLLIQAFCFFLPRIFWSTFSIKAGLYLGDLVDAAISYKSGDKFEERHNFMNYMVKNIDQFVDDKRRHDESRSQNRFVRCLGATFPCFGRFLGNFIVMLYIVTKLVFILNNVIQIYLIGGLLGQDFWQLGIKFIKSLIQGDGWSIETSKYFPKVTLCDFMIREIGNPNKSHRYTVQCVLPINLFNQQIFTVIWFWYILVLCYNMQSLVTWLHRSVPIKANQWITRRVDLFNENVKQKRVPKRLRHFLNYYLEPDGVFMLRMIANNTSDYVATDLIHHLWCQHDEKYGYLFLDEPHQSKTPCLFKHCKKEGPGSIEQAVTTQITNPTSDRGMLSGNYASFGQIYDRNRKKINNGINPNIRQEYFGIDQNGNSSEIDINSAYPPGYLVENEEASLIRRRDIDDTTTKV